MNQLATQQDDLPVSQNTNVVSVENLLQTAIEKGMDADALTKLVDLHERMLNKQAEMEFNQAMQSFQSECPPIKRSTQGKFGSYAPLDVIAKTIAPLLKKCGLSYKWESNVKNDEHAVLITSMCIIKHTQGHSDCSVFTAPVDNRIEPGKGANQMQRYAAAETYANRRSLVSALGLATTDQDIDADNIDQLFIDKNQIADLEVLLDEVKANKSNFLKWCKVDALEHLSVSKYKQAVKALEDKRK